MRKMVEFVYKWKENIYFEMEKMVLMPEALKKAGCKLRQTK